jgi:sec-independent protein translocase protein TatA
MGLDNPVHLAFLLVILLLVFGAKRLPEMGRSLGSGLRGFKESINGEAHVEALPAASTVEPEPLPGAATESATVRPAA